PKLVGGSRPTAYAGAPGVDEFRVASMPTDSTAPSVARDTPPATADSASSGWWCSAPVRRRTARLIQGSRGAALDGPRGTRQRPRAGQSGGDVSHQGRVRNITRGSPGACPLGSLRLGLPNRAGFWERGLRAPTSLQGKSDGAHSACQPRGDRPFGAEPP